MSIIYLNVQKPFERTYVYLLVNVISGGFECSNVEGLFTFILFDNTEEELYFGSNEYRYRKSF